MLLVVDISSAAHHDAALMESPKLVQLGSGFLSLALIAYVGSYFATCNVVRGSYTAAGTLQITGSSGPVLIRIFNQRWEALYRPLGFIENRLFPQRHFVGFIANLKPAPKTATR